MECASWRSKNSNTSSTSISRKKKFGTVSFSLPCISQQISLSTVTFPVVIRAEPLVLAAFYHKEGIVNKYLSKIVISGMNKCTKYYYDYNLGFLLCERLEKKILGLQMECNTGVKSKKLEFLKQL